MKKIIYLIMFILFYTNNISYAEFVGNYVVNDNANQYEIDQVYHEVYGYSDNTIGELLDTYQYCIKDTRDWKYVIDKGRGYKNEYVIFQCNLNAYKSLKDDFETSGLLDFEDVIPSIEHLIIKNVFLNVIFFKDPETSEYFLKDIKVDKTPKKVVRNNRSSKSLQDILVDSTFDVLGSFYSPISFDTRIVSNSPYSATYFIDTSLVDEEKYAEIKKAFNKGLTFALLKNLANHTMNLKIVNPGEDFSFDVPYATPISLTRTAYFSLYPIISSAYASSIKLYDGKYFPKGELKIKYLHSDRGGSTNSENSTDYFSTILNNFNFEYNDVLNLVDIGCVVDDSTFDKLLCINFTFQDKYKNQIYVQYSYAYNMCQMNLGENFRSLLLEKAKKVILDELSYISADELW